MPQQQVLPDAVSQTQAGLTGTGLDVHLRRGRGRATITRFTGPLTDLVCSLREIDTVRLLRAPTTSWFVAALTPRGDDLVVRLEPRRVAPSRTVDDILVPVRALVHGAAVLRQEPVIPEWFAPGTVRRLGKLATSHAALRGVALSPGPGPSGDLVELSAVVKGNGDLAVRPFAITPGSVTGTPSEIHEVVRGPRRRVMLRDQHGGQAVEAYVSAAMTEQLRDLGRRQVVLTGTVRRNVSGQAIRIDVERVDPVPGK